MENFNDRLKKLRHLREFSKTDIAKALGVSPTCVWNWEQGNTFPRPTALSKLANFLKTTTNYLERGVDLKSESSINGSDFNKAEDNYSDQTLSQVVEKARVEISKIAGIDLGKVKITLEY